MRGKKVLQDVKFVKLDLRIETIRKDMHEEKVSPSSRNPEIL